MVRTYTDRYEIIEILVDFIANRQVCKELGEPILIDKGDVFFIKKTGTKVIGFAAINKGSNNCLLKYMYVLPDKRGFGLFSELYTEVELYSKQIECPCIKAVCTDSALPIYLKKNFKIDKGFKNYHKISKEL